jgi:hypothetical protein
MLVPIRLTSRQTRGWMSGSTGSVKGGTKIRGPVEPIWCSSSQTWGNHSRYAARVMAWVSFCVSMNQSRLLSWPT